MTIGIIITTLILLLIIVISPVLIVGIKLRNIKEKELLKNVLTIISTINLIAILVITCLWISPIKNNDLKISKTEKKEAVTLTNAGFNEVSLDEYLTLVNSSEKSIVLVARPTCGYCEKFTPILKEAMEDLDITVNYIDTDKLTSEEDFNKFTSSVSYLTENEWGTPLVMIVQNGTVVADNQGYVELDQIKEFFTNNGFGN